MRLPFLAALLFWPHFAFSEPNIEAPETASSEEDVSAQVTGLDPNIAYWVTLVPKTKKTGTWDKYIYIENAANAEVTFKAPGIGLYEFRLHDKAKPYPLYASSEIILTAKDFIPPVFETSGSFNGPGKATVKISGLDPAIRYWLTLIPASEPMGKWAQYHYFANQTEAEVTFDPVAGGEYQLRLHDRRKGYALYLSQDISVAGGEPLVAPATTATPADTLPKFTGPCPEMSNADGASVAACLQHLAEGPVKHVFTNATSTCGHMSYQLSLAQENKEGTYQNLRSADMERFQKIDCKTISRQVEVVFGQAPGWRFCTDHPTDVGPAEHIACVDNTPVLGIGRNARSANNIRNGVNAAFPVTCKELHARLQTSYSNVFRELRDWQAFLTVFPRDMSCAPYQDYLQGNVARRKETILAFAQQRDEERQAAYEQQQARRAFQDGMENSFDDMYRQDVAARAGDIQNSGTVSKADLKWALVKVIHRLEPERNDQLTKLLHTSSGLRLSSGRGRSRVISNHSIADIDLRACSDAGENVVTCEAEVTMVSTIQAPNDQGGDTILILFGGPVRETSAISTELTYVDTQWEVARVTPDLLDVLLHAPETVQSNGGFRFEGYSPEECVWLRSMGAGGVC